MTRLSSSGGTDDAGVSRGTGFWLAYAVGWLLYGGLIVSAETAEGGGNLSFALLTVAVIAGPAALLGAVVAARRRDFFRPDRSLLGMAGLHLVTGLLYAAACALLSRLGMLGLLPLASDVKSWLEVPLVLHFLTYLFLYVLLAGFLMWTESIARVQESRAQLAREAMLRAQAEASAVRARFNPHFVFNVLHSLMLLVRKEPARAERAIEDVAGLIRYSSRLEREERDRVPLEEEMEFARRYLALEALRLEDRLRVLWEVEEGIGNVPVPSFSLQTLLENAVKHGVAPRPSGGTVRVGARREQGRVVLFVEDDGDGCSPEDVSSSDGQGLRLLRKRVEVLYGGEGDVRWTTEPEVGFRAELRVPVGAPE